MNNASIFSQLPHDLIMNIVKMNTNRERDLKARQDFSHVLEDIDDVGEQCLSDDEDNIGEVFASQFIMNLWMSKKLEEDTHLRVFRVFQAGGYHGHDIWHSDSDSESEDDDY